MQEMSENKKQIDKYLSDYLSEKVVGAEKYDSELPTHLNLIMTQIMRGGKRVRPFIFGLTYRLTGAENTENQIKMGAAIELMHQYFLIHDDIVDTDEKRYGDSSLHKAFEAKMNDSHYGESLAMISGNYINSLVYDIVLSLDVDDGIKIDILKLMHSTIRDTVMGWQIHFMQNKTPISQASEERYLKGMELVSARYTFESPALLGLLMGNNKDLVPIFKRYSYLVGMAFQMRDDELGVYGDTAITGKPSGNDLREGKKTLLILRAYKNANIEQRKYIEEHLGKEIDQKQIDELRDIITQTESLRHSEDTSRSHVMEAKDLIKEVASNNTNSIEILQELADFVINRDK